MFKKFSELSWFRCFSVLTIFWKKRKRRGFNTKMEWKRLNGEQWGSDSKRRKKTTKKKKKTHVKKGYTAGDEQSTGNKSSSNTQQKIKNMNQNQQGEDPVVCYISLSPSVLFHCGKSRIKSRSVMSDVLNLTFY